MLFLIWFVLTFAAPVWVLMTGKIDMKADYRTANRDSAKLAPPVSEQEAVIQVYAARAFSWRGIFGSHSWIAVKPKSAPEYTVYQIVGWRNWRGLPALHISQDVPDRNWFNETPRVLLDIRGQQAEKLIPRVDAAARSYPYAGPYTLWPGPNSNTFPAYVARTVPELGLALPADALGKDFLGEYRFFAKAPSGTGYQVSLFGVLGVMLAKKEGFEINLLGVVYGIKPDPWRVVLPGMG